MVIVISTPACSLTPGKQMQDSTGSSDEMPLVQQEALANR